LLSQAWRWQGDLANWGLRLYQRHTGSAVAYDLTGRFGSGTDVNLITFALNNIGIGKNNPTAPLDVLGLARFSGAIQLGGNGVDTFSANTGGFTTLNAPDGTGYMIIGGSAQGNITYSRNAANYFQNAAGSASYAVFNAGGTSNVSGAWAVISQREMKENIVPYTRGLDAVVQLNPVSFNYVAGTPFFQDEPSRPLFGLIADEVAPVVPEIVGTTTGMVRSKEVMLDTLEPSNLVYALINSCKELATRLAALEARIGAP
jgi:hypothetical protein